MTWLLFEHQLIDAEAMSRALSQTASVALQFQPGVGGLGNDARLIDCVCRLLTEGESLLQEHCSAFVEEVRDQLIHLKGMQDPITKKAVLSKRSQFAVDDVIGSKFVGTVSLKGNEIVVCSIGGEIVTKLNGAVGDITLGDIKAAVCRERNVFSNAVKLLSVEGALLSGPDC